MIEQAAAVLAGGVEHRTSEARVRHGRDERRVGAQIGEHHTDDLRLSRERVERANALGPGRIRKQSDLDEIDSGAGHRRRGAQDRFALHRQIADDGADRPLPGDAGDRRSHLAFGERTERAFCRVLQVDDVGATRDRDLGLFGAGHAGQEQRHGTAPLRAASIRLRTSQSSARDQDSSVLPRKSALIWFLRSPVVASRR